MMPVDTVYLDFAATTPVDPTVAKCMTEYLTADGEFANPSATHIAGRRASDAVDRAATQMATLLGCRAPDLVWTSGATESNNLAILGAAGFREHRGKHLITMSTEHKAVADVFAALERAEFEVTWLSPGPNGVLDPDTLKAAFRTDTQLVSIMHVNNETGVLQDIAALGEQCRTHDVLFHVDAAQSVGKLPIDLAELPVDLMSMTAHKIYGPKGIGALYLSDRQACRIQPLMYGGGQQGRLRPGTLPVHLVAGFGLAAEIACERMHADLNHVTKLRNRLWAGIRNVHGILLNGEAEYSFPGLLNVSVEDIQGESLLLALEPLCVASGSACNSQNQEPSKVLRALGRTDALAQSAIRFSFGRSTTERDIDFAIERYCASVARLRSIAPAQVA